MTLESRRSYRVFLWLSALLLAALTYLQPGTHLEFIGGIDHSWAYALNYAADKKLVMGRDLFFTFGPLGYLEHTRVVSLALLYQASAFSLIISILMNAALLHLACLTSQGRPFLRLCNLALALALVIFSFPHLQRLLLLGYALVLLHWFTGNRAYLIGFCLFVVLCVLIKFSYGAVALSLWGAYLLLWVWQRREYRVVAWLLAGMVLAYWGVWGLVYGHWEGSLGYLQAEYYISKGNAAAMALNPDNNPWAIVFFYGSMLLAALLAHRHAGRDFAWVPLVFLPPLLVWTKYSFSQQEPFHLYPIVAFALWTIGLAALVVQGFWQKLKMLLLAIVAWNAWEAMHTPSIGAPDYRNAPHVTLNHPEIAQYRFSLKKLFYIWRKAEKERLAPLVLPVDMRQQIGNASVDIYPWELTIASVNHLNWQPRPVFQIYISYLPFLDQKNSEHFRSERAPEYVIWHHHFYQDIMARYGLSTEPLTVAALLDRYRMLYCKGYFCLWQRSAEPQLRAPVEAEPQTVRWNEWIPLPEERGDILRARISADRTLLGELNLLAWKEGGITIDYQLNDGVVKTHDLLIDNAVSGVWIAPYHESHLGYAANAPQEISPAQRRELLAAPVARANLEKVERTLGGHRVVGWGGVPGVEDAPEESYFLFYNESRAFLLPTQLFERPDVVGALAALSERISPRCGFDDDINERLLPVGEYRVRLALRSGGQWALSPDQGFVLTHDPAQVVRDRVVQVRLRTTRPWAFDKDIQLQWQQLSFVRKDALTGRKMDR